MDELKAPGKPFGIPKPLVMEAWEKGRAKKGAPGVDAVAIEEFEEDLRGNLYRVWNRMSSGCYFPPPVRMVEIPKPQGGIRVLGVPTVGDRVAQTGWRWCWRRGLSRSSIRTPTDTARDAGRSTRWAGAGSGAGSTTG
ncbi:hypothetical protein [Streptomyces sp. NPDC055006]